MNENNNTPATEERTFTQDDVNRIVQERLAKEREKNVAKPDDAAASLAEREKALEAREAEITTNAFVQKWKVEADKLKGFSAADIDTLSKGLDALGITPNPNALPDIPLAANGIPSSDLHIRQAMGLNKP